MKIAIDISQIVYGTGVSTYTENLVSNLIKVDKKNEYLIFGTSFRHYSYLKNYVSQFSSNSNVQIKLFRFPISFFEILFNKTRFIPVEKLIGNFDLIHTSDWIEPKVSSSARKITTIHDAVPYLFPTTLPKKILRNHLQRHKLIKKETAKVIVPSITTKEDAQKLIGIPPEKLVVINEAVSQNFKPQPEEKTYEVLKKFKIKRPFVLSVSTQEPRKNIHTLLDAFEDVSKEHDDLYLVLVGKEGWGQMLELIPNTIQTGYVTTEELVTLYASCKVFIYPSLYEGFGLPVLEAMACGAPVITSNNSAMAEIAKDAAILVDPRNEKQIQKAIQLILDLKTEDFQKMVRASLDKARQFSWVKTAKETLKVYEEVFNSVNV